jgi:KDO2-lipid IV(A) lauroyltransferase
MGGLTSFTAKVTMALSRRGSRIVPLSLANAFAAPIGELVGMTWASKFEMAKKNYAHVLGLPIDHPKVAVTARNCFRHFGRYPMESIAVQGWGTDEVVDLVDVVGHENFGEAEAHGKGVIFVTGHMGATEIGAAVAVVRGYKITTVVEQMHPAWLFEYLTISRQRMGITLLPAGRSGVSLLRTLRKGGMAAFVVDAGIERGGAVQVEFFGRPTLFPDGPARLSRLSGAPLVFGTCVRRPGGRFRAYVFPPVLPDRGAEASTDARRVTQEVARSFEGMVRRYPSQWYAFREMWPEHQAAGVTAPPVFRASE